MTMSEVITMSHGNGGVLMHELISGIFFRYFQNEIINEQSDSAVVDVAGQKLAFTTDSFVVDPIFFPGGDIGKLSVCGTLNDLAVSGATPLYLSAGFILEEGFRIRELERIVKSMATEAKRAGVSIVTGDTKVVDRGKCDKIFINTSGIGIIEERNLVFSSGAMVKPGDKIILNGPPGEHGMTIMQERKLFAFKTSLKSDCTNLHPMIRKMLHASGRIHFMRDATRGGVATVLHEIMKKSKVGIEIDESLIPVNDEVSVMCELLGFDPLFVANEGKLVTIVDPADADIVLAAMHKTIPGKNAAVIGEITGTRPGRLIMKSVTGGKKLLDELRGDQLPRIC